MKKLIPLLLFAIFLLNISIRAQTVLNEHNIVVEKKLHPPPVPYFFITGLCFGDTTHFINKTDASLISLEWNITNDKGDTIYRSPDAKASYYFKKRGFYSVCLTANNGHIASKTRIVRIDTIPKADFTFRYCYDIFDNLSACSDQFVWVLPDNSISTDTTPAYTFATPGKYPVKLISKKGNKSDTLFKFINVRGDSVGVPNAAFTCKRIDTSATFEFTAVDSLAISYSWYFGDNQGDDTSGYKVIHLIDRKEYKPPVNLFITNGCGTSVDILDPFEATTIEKEKKTTFTTTLYPNPATDELNVLINNVHVTKCLIRLIDANGVLMEEKKLENVFNTVNYTFTTSQLANGMYLLQLVVGNELLNKKFIIQ